MYFLVGPVVSAIANKVGFRPVAMVGGVICAVSVFGGSYCRTWLGLTVCYGFIGKLIAWIGFVFYKLSKDSF